MTAFIVTGATAVAAFILGYYCGKEGIGAEKYEAAYNWVKTKLGK